MIVVYHRISFLHVEHQPGNRKSREEDIERLAEKFQQKGLTLVPFRLYFNDRGRVKLEIAIGRGRKNYDRRETIKKWEAGREIDRAMKESRS